MTGFKLRMSGVGSARFTTAQELTNRQLSFSTTILTKIIVGFSATQTRIVEEEGKHADHLTIKMAPNQSRIVASIVK